MSDETTVVETDKPGTDLVVLLKGPTDRWPALVEHLKAVVKDYFQKKTDESDAILADAKAIALTTDSPDDLYVKALQLRKKTAKGWKENEKEFKPFKARVDLLKKVFTAIEKADDVNRQAALDILDPALNAWEKEREKLLATEIEKLEKAARKEEEKVIAAQAKKLLDEGFIDEAEKLAFGARSTPTVAAPSLIPKVPGESKIKKYGAEGVYLKALVKAAAADDKFLAYLCFNESAINKVAEAQKELFELPGCKLVTDWVRTSR